MKNAPVTGLRDKAFGAVLWSFLDRFGQYGIQVVVSIVLARLLLPNEIGLIGMLWVVIILAQHVVHGGFGQALMQKLDADRADASSVFHFNTVIACVAAVLVWLAAPWIGEFYGVPSLVPLARAMALSLPIEALGFVHATLLTKRLDLRTQAVASGLAAVLSGTVGIGMAYIGFGAWSLVGQALTQLGVRTAALWYLGGWRPAFVFRLDSLRAMSPVGSRVLASSLLNALSRGLPTALIGRVYAAQAVGYYLTAGRIPILISDSLSTIVSRVTQPVYPGLRDDPARFQGAFRKALTMIASLITPLMVGLCVMAEPVVRIVLSDTWLPAVPYLRLHCLIMAISPLQTANLEAVLSVGRPRLWLRLDLARKALGFLALFVSYRWGVQAVLLGDLGASLVALCLAAWGVSRAIGYSPWRQARDLLPYGLVSLAMGGAVYLAGRIAVDPAVELAIGVLVGLTSYLAMGIAFRLEAFRDLGVLSAHGWTAVFGSKRLRRVSDS